MTPAEVKVVVDLMQELGPDVSAAELQRLAKTSNVEMSINDVQTVVEIQEEIGGDKKLSNAEIQVSKFELDNWKCASNTAKDKAEAIIYRDLN